MGVRGVRGVFILPFVASHQTYPTNPRTNRRPRGVAVVQTLLCGEVLCGTALYWTAVPPISQLSPYICNVYIAVDLEVMSFLFVLLSLLSFLCGVFVSLQALVNSSLGFALGGYGILACLISFSIGLAFLTLIILLESYWSPLSGGRFLTFKETPHWTLLLPGSIGVAFVCASVFLPPGIGFGLYFVSLVSGQMFAAVIADKYGLGVAEGRRIPVSISRGFSLALATVGVVLSVLDTVLNPSTSQPVSPGTTVLYCVIAASVGMASTAQSVLNRWAAALLPSKFQATWWSFFTGTIIAGVVFGIQAGALGGASVVQATLASAQSPFRWEVFLGGPLGLVFVAGAIYMPTIIGSSAHTVLMVAGNLVASAVTDSTGALNFVPRKVSPSRAVGVVLVILAAIAMQFEPLKAAFIAWRAKAAGGEDGRGGRGGEVEGKGGVGGEEAVATSTLTPASPTIEGEEGVKTNHS